MRFGGTASPDIEKYIATAIFARLLRPFPGVQKRIDMNCDKIRKLVYSVFLLWQALE